ncbi:hypothetical protein GCK72_006742 [Caenorhabditis remanei]|uniref:ShKT domain-containing protein n=1 Tax=Caenorhabditis remanei TaxID=31234 RepID=A0A6A5HJK9_CAERE|nr:hypothetical protein GCK72_006742 [Caenorhabditis remanei]KAF1766784.1 hypothetical protein GCK72_006742 [Caenorhabditis remanei]
MYTLLALLAVVLVPALAQMPGSPDHLGFPSQQTTCRVRTIRRSNNNMCPTGYTVVSNGECCPSQQVNSTGTTCVDKRNANGVNECLGWRTYCDNIFYKNFMTENCPKTCGFCNTATMRPGVSSTIRPGMTTTRPWTNNCTDKLATGGFNECLGWRRFCRNVSYREFMTENCARTCGFCSSSTMRPGLTSTTRRGTLTSTSRSVTLSNTCTDKLNASGSNACAVWRSYCNDIFYKDFMTENCPQTCGFCTPFSGSSSTLRPGMSSTVRPGMTSRPGSCIDSRSDCPSNRNLCNNYSFREQMRIQCPRTCGFCQ